MIDIHCHILFGLDDGAENISESVEMAKIARDGGSSYIVATPHCNMSDIYMNPWGEGISSKIDAVNKTLAEKGIGLEILPGQEIYCGDHTVDKLKGGQLITLNNSRYPLIEFNFYQNSSFLYEQVWNLSKEGYVPIIAHPERYAFVQENPESISRIKSLGALIQVNKGSLRGNFGRSAYDCADFIVANRLADFIASDAHSPFSRTPYLESVYEIISENYSFDYADFLLKENPRCVIENKPNILY